MGFGLAACRVCGCRIRCRAVSWLVLTGLFWKVCGGAHIQSLGLKFRVLQSRVHGHSAVQVWALGFTRGLHLVLLRVCM